MRYDMETLQRLGIMPSYVDIKLNGQVIRDIIAFDPMEGFVEVYRKADGKAVIENEKYVVDTLHGAVVAHLVHAPNGRWPHPGFPAPDVDRVLLTSIRR